MSKLVIHQAGHGSRDVGQYCLLCDERLIGGLRNPWDSDVEDPDFWPYGTLVLVTGEEPDTTTLGLSEHPDARFCNSHLKEKD